MPSVIYGGKKKTFFKQKRNQFRDFCHSICDFEKKNITSSVSKKKKKKKKKKKLKKKTSQKKNIKNKIRKRGKISRGKLVPFILGTK